MFSLTLLSFSPLSRETNIVAIALAVAALLLDNLVIPEATLISSTMTGIVAGGSWYVYKLFDGLSYDETPTVYGSFIGLIAVLALNVLFFWV
jgi:hypothetical protein